MIRCISFIRIVTFSAQNELVLTISCLPEKQRRDNTSPHFRHDVKYAEAPVFNDSKRGRESWREILRQPTDKSNWVKCTPIWVDEGRKRRKKQKKGCDQGIEYLLVLHGITHFCIESRKANRCRKVDICLDEGNDYVSWKQNREMRSVNLEFTITPDDTAWHVSYLQRLNLLQPIHLWYLWGLCSWKGLQRTSRTMEPTSFFPQLPE